MCYNTNFPDHYEQEYLLTFSDAALPFLLDRYDQLSAADLLTTEAAFFRKRIYRHRENFLRSFKYKQGLSMNLADREIYSQIQSPPIYAGHTTISSDPNRK